MVHQTRAKRDTMRKRLVEITNSLEELKPALGVTVDGRGTTVDSVADDIRTNVDYLWEGIDGLTHLNEANDVQRSVIARLNDMMDDLEETGNEHYKGVITLLDLVRTDLEMRFPDGSPDFAQYMQQGMVPAEDALKALHPESIRPDMEFEPQPTNATPQPTPTPEKSVVNYDIAFPMLQDGTGHDYVAFVGGPDGDAIVMTQRWLGDTYPYLNLRHGTHVTQLDRTSVARLLPYFVNFVVTGHYDCATRDEVKEKYGD